MNSEPWVTAIDVARHLGVVKDTVYRWRERKGLPYQDKYLEYEAQLARFSNDMKVRRIISLNGHEPLKPWNIPVPNYIPES